MLRYLTAVGLAIGAAACTPSPSTVAPSTPAEPAASVAPASYRPVVSINEVMVYVVDSHANELWDAAVKPPTSDEGWRALQRAAIAIAASGNLTGLGGSGPKDQQWIQEANWATHSQEVADAGVSALNAVRNRDLTQLSQAGDRLVLTCINCHREYKLDVPRIWTERPFPPEEQSAR